MNFIKLTDFTGSYLTKKVTTSELATVAYCNPYVSMVINRIANTTAFLKLEENIELLDTATKYKIYVNLLLFGEVFILGIKPVGMSKISKLEVLNNTDVQVTYNEASPFKEITKYNYFTNEYKKEDVLHIMYANPVDQYPRGLSPLNSCQAIYKASNSINQFEQFLYENRGVVGFLSGVGDMMLTATEQAKIQAEFQGDTAGTVNAGKIKLVGNEVKYTPVTFKPSEMLSNESQLQKLRTICSVYNVDSSLFNDPANQTYNNVGEANKAFYNHAVLPIADLVNSALSGFLGEEIVIDYNDIDALKKDATLDANAKNTLSTARKTLVESIKMELELGLISIEEAKPLLTE